MHSRLEQYLQTVEQHLNALPPEEQHQEISEIRLHMESLLEANRELSSTEEEAVDQTLAQFGRAQMLGQDLIDVHQSGGKPQIRTLAGAVAFHYAAGILVSHILTPLLRLTLLPSGHVSTLYLTLWITSSLLTTLCIGWLTGVAAPRYAVKGALYAHLIGTSIGLLWMPSVPLWEAILMLLPRFVITAPSAMLGAKLGIKWRNRRIKKMRIVR